VASDLTPQFGVVLLNWNNAPDTLTALDSLWNASPRPAAVVVVDSASADDSVVQLERWAATNCGNSSWFKLIVLPSNRGFAGGNNAGIEYLLSRPEITHVFLLNNDAMVETSFFAELSNALRVAPRAGLLTGTIFEHPNRDKVWYAGGREIPFRALIEHTFDVPSAPTPVETEFISGCAMLISRPVIERLGMLPDAYFPLYSEDAEYSHRARKAGFQVLYAPKAIVYHKVGATVGPAKTSPYIMRAQVRHRVMYVRRNFRGLNRVVASLYLIATKPARALVETLMGRPKMGWAVFAGTVEGFMHRES
jgi:GT2 family glycosyltransferase